MGVIFAKKTKAQKSRKLPPRENFHVYSIYRSAKRVWSCRCQWLEHLSLCHFKRKWHVDCKEVRCCSIYDNQTFKISIFCSYCLHWITSRLCTVRHPSPAGCSKSLTFCRFEIWEIWHFCVKVSNITTNFVVKRCKYKYWIAFCRCSRAIWIASERIANFQARRNLICSSFRCNLYGPWTPTKCDSMLNFITSIPQNACGASKSKTWQRDRQVKWRMTDKVIDHYVALCFTCSTKIGSKKFFYGQADRKLESPYRCQKLNLLMQCLHVLAFYSIFFLIFMLSNVHFLTVIRYLPS